MKPAQDYAKRFVCGTRARIQKGPHDWRVVCATCDGGGTILFDNPTDAARAAIRDSNKPCQSCGAR